MYQNEVLKLTANHIWMLKGTNIQLDETNILKNPF